MSKLDWSDIFSTRALLAHSFRVRHLLAFAEVVEADTLNSRGMEEKILTTPRVDEPKSFFH